MISGILPVSIGIHQEQNQQLITVLAVTLFDQFSSRQRVPVAYCVCVCVFSLDREGSRVVASKALAEV